MKYLIAGLVSLALASSGLCSQQNIVVVFDASGSMGSRFSHAKDGTRKIDAAKTALKQILANLPPNTNIGIVVFGAKNGWIYKLGTLDKAELTKSIDNVGVGGGTPLGKYMKIGANALLELRAKQKSGVYKLIVVTDGESDDDVDKPLIGQYGILSKGIQVEVIGVDMSGRHTLATKVSYRGAESPDELKQAVQAVVAESTGKNDHSEDYDLIASIPPEVAMTALQALSETDNTPIGEKPAASTGSALPWPVASGGGGMPVWGWVLIGVGVFIAVCVVATAANKSC